MTTRAAFPSDAVQIALIWNHAIRETTITFNPDEKPIEEVAALTAQNTFVFEDKGRVLGFARYFPFRAGAGYRFTVEHTIMLHADARGKGAGRALMAALCAHAKDAGIHSIYAGCSAENAGAVDFHGKLGFQKVATLPEVGFKFGRWIDLVLMQKTL